MSVNFCAGYRMKGDFVFSGRDQMRTHVKLRVLFFALFRSTFSHCESEEDPPRDSSTVEIVIMHRMIIHKSHIAWVFLGTKLSKHGIVP